MIEGGAGKTILFGEHFVVHGEPALVFSLPLYTSAQLVDWQGGWIIDQRPKHPAYVPFKHVAYEEMARVISRYFKVERKYSYLLAGTLPVTSGGIGASAAASVSITKALAAAVNKKLLLEEVITIALEGERVIHGNPSGIDVVAACKQGLLTFLRQEGKFSYRSLITPSLTLPLLLVDSQQPANTRNAINHVQRFKDEQPANWKECIAEYRDIFEAATTLLRSLEESQLLTSLGKLFNWNNDLLERLGLGCCHARRVRQVAETMGALGSKMTGSCQGGLVLVLGRDEEHSAQMATSFEAQGFFVVNASAGGNNISRTTIKPAASHAL